MSIRLMSAVWRTRLPLTEKMVLLIIADHANDEGTEAWPSQATIAAKGSITIRTVQRSVNNLVAKGYIRLQKHAGGSLDCREDRRPHRYTIIIHRLRADIETGRKERHDLDNLSDTTSTPDTERLSRPKNHPLEPPKEPLGDFALFWKEYPLKVGKQAARKAFEKAARTAKAEDIIAGAKRYSLDPNRHPSYTAYPATWLNAGRWADDPLPDRELSADEKKALEAAERARKAELERLDREAWKRALEEQRQVAVPMPEEVKEMLRKTLRNA